jgi:hypothetical protein
MATFAKYTVEVIKELQEQVNNLKREVEQLKTEDDKTPPQKTGFLQYTGMTCFPTDIDLREKPKYPGKRINTYVKQGEIMSFTDVSTSNLIINCQDYEKLVTITWYKVSGGWLHDFCKQTPGFSMVTILKSQKQIDNPPIARAVKKVKREG